MPYSSSPEYPAAYCRDDWASPEASDFALASLGLRLMATTPQDDGTRRPNKMARRTASKLARAKMGWLRRNLARHSSLERRRLTLDTPLLAAGSFILPDLNAWPAHKASWPGAWSLRLSCDRQPKLPLGPGLLLCHKPPAPCVPDRYLQR